MTGMQIDINTGDLLVNNGGAIVASSDTFVAELVLTAFRGELREYPLLGAEAYLLLAGEYDPFWPGNTRKMLRACGLEVNGLVLSSDGIVRIT